MAYGEPYDSAVANLAVQGQDIEASQVVLALHGVQIDGQWRVRLESKHLHGHIEGDNLVLSKFADVREGEPECGWDADAGGGCEWHGGAAGAEGDAEAGRM